jgi:hypothetical protein
MNRNDMVAIIRQSEGQSILHDPQVCIIHDRVTVSRCLAFTDHVCVTHGGNCQSYRTNLVHKGCTLKYDDGKFRRFEEA